MLAVRSRRVWACVGVLLVLMGMGTTLPARIYLPLQMGYNVDSSEGGVEGVSGTIPQRRGRDMAAHPPAGVYELLPQKRYLGIELPDFIADSKNLGKLKERMLSSGK